jgi:hypothetical protein
MAPREGAIHSDAGAAAPPDSVDRDSLSIHSIDPDTIEKIGGNRLVIRNPYGPVSGNRAVRSAISSLSQSEPGDVQNIAASQTELLVGYYDAVLNHANKSFFWALIAAAIGLAFFVSAMVFLGWNGTLEVGVIGAVGGAIVEVIAGVNFVLYGKATTQLGDFH